MHSLKICDGYVRPNVLRMSKEEPARRYALYIPTIGKRRPGWPHTSYLNYVQRLLGDNEGAMQEQQIAAFADDCRARRNLVVACSAADGWWWWCAATLTPIFKRPVTEWPPFYFSHFALTLWPPFSKCSHLMTPLNDPILRNRMLSLNDPIF